MTVEYLEWDSSFFNRKIGRIDANEPLSAEFLESFSDSGFDTIYLFSSVEQPVAISLGFPLVDEKVTWEQELPKELAVPQQEFFLPEKKSDALLNLFCESGAFSRFKLDPVFTSEFSRFYEKWMTNAINENYDDYILCMGPPNDPTGVITLKRSNEELVISIIAVSANHRGKGIGRQLVDKAKSIAIENELFKLSVATQAANRTAMRFYEKTDFKMRSREYIYHLHLKSSGSF
jgi:dTDP-4-amino-4,6-dideoxy-D-galactose acyltransferase